MDEHTGLPTPEVAAAQATTATTATTATQGHGSRIVKAISVVEEIVSLLQLERSDEHEGATSFRCV